MLLIGAMYLVFQEISLVVKTDGSHSLEENMRQTLLACYAEFGDILKQLAITHVGVNDSNCSSLKIPREIKCLELYMLFKYNYKKPLLLQTCQIWPTAKCV